MDKGNFIIGSITEESLLQAVDVAVEMQKNGDNGEQVQEYTDKSVSTKVVKIIQSFTSVVNSWTWKKY
jgi:UDP-N-acetylglucosamine 2-epimerase (non-hydrolysing)